MAVGDLALAAGFDILDPATDLVKDGATEINKVLDLLAQRTATILPVVKGGTGADNATGARQNLQAAAANHNHDGAYVGLGGSDVGPLSMSSGGGRPQLFGGGNYLGHVAYLSDLSGGDFVSKAGDTMTGHLWLPNSTAATSGYTICYINGDGRVSRGASTERVKKDIRQWDPASLGDVFPDLYRFKMRTGDGSWTYGWIAERLHESPDLQPFVVYETEEDGKTLAVDSFGLPVPLSIDFISLLIVQTSVLAQRAESAEARLAALEARLEALENS